MRLAICHIPPDARGKRSGLALSPGASSVRFGEDVVLYADEAQWKKVAERAQRDNFEIRERSATVNRERLHIVVQNGRLFQQQHPEVPVLLDRGRFLLVELDSDRAHQLERKSPTCYGVLPLSENQIVFDVQEPLTARAGPNASIQNLVDKLSRPTLESDLIHLVSFSTRFSTSTNYANASAEARNQFKAMGYTTRFQNITVNGGKSRNVIADKKGGAAGARKVVLVTAHLDSINLAGGPTAPAPGADDNGSGSAGLLEMARAFQAHRGNLDLRFILFGGEEEGLFGSKQYVASLSTSQRARIQSVVNMDMIGTLNISNRKVLLEGAPLSQGIINGLSEAAATYTQLTVETSLHPFASDHVPFIEQGIPAVLTIEGADSTNSNIHSSKDTIDHINYDLALEILRMNTAFVASQIGQLP